MIVGCGNIAAAYATDLKNAGVVNLVGFYDVSSVRAEAFAAEHGGIAFATLDDAVSAAELIVNLTIFEAHYPVSKAALGRGCHVYSEKPLALHLEEARELVNLAERNSVRLGAAPFSSLGQAQATAIDWIVSGRLGEVRVAYAEANHGRIETWHPNPSPFYEVGPMLDVGVYPVALLLAAFGRVSEVRAMSSVIHPNRIDLEGNTFRPGSPDFWLVELVHETGQQVRLTVNFYVKGSEGIEFHGDDGSLLLESWFDPNARLTHIPYGGDEEDIDIGPAPDQLDWSSGIAAFVAGIETGDSPINAANALHMVEILTAIDQSAAIGETIELMTTR